MEDKRITYSGYFDTLVTKEADLFEKLDNEDHIGVVLRTCFLIEEYLNEWIKTKVNYDLFKKTRATNNLMINVALNAGIGKELASAFQSIFEVRNALAHNKTQGIISDNHIKNMEIHLNSFLKSMGAEGETTEIMAVSDGYGGFKHMHHYDKSDNRVKYIMIFGDIYNNLTLHAMKSFPEHFKRSQSI